IPDYLPAVFKIVKCLIEPVVLQNHVADGRWQGEGYLRCTVYYQSDEAGCRLYRTEQKFSFEKSVELPEGTYIAGPAFLWGEVEYCNCRSISEHRIDIRGAYALCISVLGAAEAELLTSLADCGIEQRTRALGGSLPAAAVEKTLTAETGITLPGAGEAILDIGGLFLPEASTVQTGQVNCKGTLQMQVCFRAAEAEELTTRSKELPIQQSLEVPGAAEGDEVTFWGEVLSCTLAAANDADDPVLTVTWKLHVELWRPVSYMAVADAYSTLCRTEVQRATIRLLQPLGPVQETVKVELEDDLPDPEGEVKGCFVTLGTALATVGEKADTVRLAGKGAAHVLCADSRGEMTCYDKTFSWHTAGEWPGKPETYVARLHASAARISSGKSGARLRVEAEIAVTGTLLRVADYEVVSAVELGEEFPDRGEGPALTLYYAAEGERLFDIAKRYHARAKDLAAANHLEVGETAVQELTTGAACLLIPAAL
ncbi:MAG: DUF3794 domain-containing protein, partial [Gemmiger sp.]